jgi:hypothetical protein
MDSSHDAMSSANAGTEFDAEEGDVLREAQALAYVLTDLCRMHNTAAVAISLLIVLQLRRESGIGDCSDGLDEEFAHAGGNVGVRPPQFPGNIGKKRRIRLPNRQRDRGYANTEMDALTGQQFKRLFRMSRNGFNSLLTDIGPFLLTPNEQQAKNGSATSISAKTRLAVTLRWLAGGSYLDICFSYGVGVGTFFQADGPLWNTMEAIDAALDIGFPFDDPDELAQMASEYAELSRGVLKHCVLAVDGWVCRTRKPQRGEVDNPMAYRNRHGCFGLVVLAGCDARLRFHMFSVVSTGSTNDVLAWPELPLSGSALTGITLHCVGQCLPKLVHLRHGDDHDRVREHIGGEVL